MMLLQEAHRLIGAEFWELSLTPAYIDPFVMLWWKGEEGRAARLRKEATEKCLSQAAALAHSNLNLRLGLSLCLMIANRRRHRLRKSSSHSL